MKFITSAENAIAFGKATGRMPVRTDAAGDPHFSTALFSGFLEAMDYCVALENFPEYTNMMDMIGEAYSTVLAGSATVDEAYATLCDKVEALLNEYN